MTADFHGLPCWYELSAADADAAQAFYGALLGWSWTDSGMAGMDYRLAGIGGTMIAGLASHQAGDPPPAWRIYFAVTDADATVAAMAADGAQAIVPPTDIPGTGRFAILADPQGAVFGLLQPLPMEDGTGGGAFDQAKAGHGNWHELATRDSRAALGFYGRHLGWTLSRSMEMGPGMTYHVFARNGQEIGGMMDLAPGMPDQPFWLPYFGAEGIDAAVAAIRRAGGAIRLDVQEVPGGAFMTVATDPQGVVFALVGPR